MMLRKKGVAATRRPRDRRPSALPPDRSSEKTATSRPRGDGCGRKSAYGEGELDGAEAAALCGRGFDAFARDRAFGNGGIGSRMFQTQVCIGQS
jgi:hypothetical protein